MNCVNYVEKILKSTFESFSQLFFKPKSIFIPVIIESILENHWKINVLQILDKQERDMKIDTQFIQSSSVQKFHDFYVCPEQTEINSKELSSLLSCVSSQPVERHYFSIKIIYLFMPPNRVSLFTCLFIK